MAEPRVPRLELPSFRRRLRLPSWQRLTRREIRAELDGGQSGSYRCSGTASRISNKASCGKVAARTPNELSSAWNRVDRDAIRGIPTRIVKRDLQTRKILFHRCRCAPQVLLLPLARFSRIVKVRGHGLVEPAILMLDQDEPFDSVLFHEKTQPLPARPGKLGQILKKCQAQGPARNHHQIVILIQIEPTVQKLVETCLKPVIAAVDYQYFGFTDFATTSVCLAVASACFPPFTPSCASALGMSSPSACNCCSKPKIRAGPVRATRPMPPVPFPSPLFPCSITTTLSMFPNGAATAPKIPAEACKTAGSLSKMV